MVSVPISSPRELALTSVSTSYRGLASEKASQTLQANFAQASYIRPSSRLVSDEVTPIKAHTSCSKSLPPKLQLIQAKIFANTRETEGMPANNPLGNGSNITPPTASVESLASTTESNDTLNQPSPETSHSDPSLLGATLSTDSPTQSLITVNMYSSSSNLESLGSLHNSLTVLTTSSKQVDLGIERFASVTTGSDKSPSDGSNDDLEQTEITEASLIRTSDEGRMQLGHFSHTQMENQNASQGETTQGSYGPQLSTTRVDISPHPSSTTTTDIVFSNPTNSSTVDGSGVSRQPSKQSLSAIFGSYVIEISETRVSKGIPYIVHVEAAKKAQVQN
ncbi:uncharacterized protein N7458_002478 [Penicillium daleae]|uniref:Uncharacterized protein n=1 Tax=Penicillium daleae TaxID=63821 RepID=A0AAD6G699_9EURO|nr:uncharacterized protein N7458_002478 [Penicillium daleae]KAJ5460926.1 hypothetical protein N7458_002478 [Penicillium daleae]